MKCELFLEKKVIIFYVNMINTSILKGHKAGILCVESNGSNNILSGSDDKTARLWDLRTLKTSRAFLNVFE